jgi:ribosomal protein L24E
MTYKTKQCQYCNTSYTPTSGKQKFCSSKCFNKIKAQKVMKSRDPVQYREYMREFRAKNQERIRQ